MSYRSLGSIIRDIMEKKTSHSAHLLPIIDAETGKVTDETPVNDPEEPAVAAGDSTANYPADDHPRVEEAPKSHKEKIKLDLKRAMRAQHKMKIIDNP